MMLSCLLSGLCLLLWVVEISTQENCNLCDCTVRDEQGESRVRTVQARCQEGRITWLQPFGALRLELKPLHSGNFQMCFVIDSGMTRLKVSKESLINWKSPDQEYPSARFEIEMLAIAHGKTKEMCLTSAASIVLYIEAERTFNISVFERILIYYDMELLSRRMMLDPLEECRPCSDSEILRAYCSSDFVVVGTVEDVFHNDETEKTEIGVNVMQIIRQRETLFHRKDRGSKTLQGTIMAPKKCGVRHGPGTFLFTGRLKLGYLKFGCAPYLTDWEMLVKRAEDEGTLECSRD
ncbi:hypothetical protein CHS0354_041786 [Potamilus streckersoni]|uniref:Meteorin-like protein n=1 Tax=Potamilus streckersoni TaxID=2493646 RepID=A0AAE0T1N4_9BIVA|nr:hypothetical protein CHS0354_041786 [Potamilus streckersoni]